MFEIEEQIYKGGLLARTALFYTLTIYKLYTRKYTVLFFHLPGLREQLGANLKGEIVTNKRRKRQREKRRVARKQENEEIPVVKIIKPVTKVVLRRPRVTLIRGSVDNPIIHSPEK